MTQQQPAKAPQVDSEAPTCDVHAVLLGKPGVPATVDGKTVLGPWAFMCDACHFTYGVGFGVGKGQTLRGVDDGAQVRQCCG